LFNILSLFLYSLRAQFAVDDAINSLHGSDSEDTAKKELQFFFPMEQTMAVIKPDAEGTKGKKCKHNGSLV
jgi:nucleoside diphosphate kinase